jgi:hypothetical protein
MNRSNRRLQEDANRAGQACDQATRAERRAWQEHQQGRGVDLQLAQPIEMEAHPQHGPGMGLVLLALAAGAVAAAAAGAISKGVTMESPMTTVEQARDALPVPVVGVIPEDEAASEASPAPR